MPIINENFEDIFIVMWQTKWINDFIPQKKLLPSYFAACKFYDVLDTDENCIDIKICKYTFDKII